MLYIIWTWIPIFSERGGNPRLLRNRKSRILRYPKSAHKTEHHCSGNSGTVLFNTKRAASSTGKLPSGKKCFF